MLNFVAAWVALLIVVAIFAQQTLNVNVAQIAANFLTLPFLQKFLICVIALMVLWLIGAFIWQSERILRQDKRLKSLQQRLDGFRHGAALADEAQRDVDAAVRHLASNDTEDALSSLQKRLKDAESQTTLQQGRIEAVDMPDRLEEIRHRQQALREKIGDLSEQRRAIQPVFDELKERQTQLERSLAEVETDNDKNPLAERLKELSAYVMHAQARVSSLRDSLTTLGRMKEEMEKSQTDLTPLRAPDSGIEALIGELHARRDVLLKALDQLELNGDQPLSGRIEELSKNKHETEQRFARLNNFLSILDTIRSDFDGLKERQEHLESALVGVETDLNGKSLADRQKDLNDFAIQARARLNTLENSLVTLNRLKEELDKSQANLLPLQSPDAGIEAIICELHDRRDRLTKTLDELESHGDQKLGVSVEAISKSKIESEQRVAQIVDHFAKLDSIRKDIGGLFTKLSATVDKLR